MADKGDWYRRPSTVPLGRTWLTFQGRSRDGPEETFEVRDVEPHHEEQCLELMMEVFLNDEPLCKALDLRSDPISVKTVRSDWQHLLQQRVSVACFNAGGEMVAANILLVKRRADKLVYSRDGSAWSKLLQTLQACEDQVNVFDRYGVEQYLASTGIAVKRAYRGQGVGEKIIEARKHICSALNLPASVAVYTAGASQVIAARCGYEVLATLPYRVMAGRGVKLDHPIIQDNPIAQLRGVKFNT